MAHKKKHSLTRRASLRSCIISIENGEIPYEKFKKLSPILQNLASMQPQRTKEYTPIADKDNEGWFYNNTT